jgi:hypothetical protein
MKQEELQKYQEVAKRFKEIIDAITTLEFSQLKLFLVRLEKKIAGKE